MANNPFPKDPRVWGATTATILIGAVSGFFADDVADAIIDKTPVFPFRKYIVPGSFIVGGILVGAAAVKAKGFLKSAFAGVGMFLAMVGFKFLDAKRRPRLTAVSSQYAGYNIDSAGNRIDYVMVAQGNESSLYNVKVATL